MDSLEFVNKVQDLIHECRLIEDRFVLQSTASERQTIYKKTGKFGRFFKEFLEKCYEHQVRLDQRVDSPE